MINGLVNKKTQRLLGLLLGLTLLLAYDVSAQKTKPILMASTSFILKMAKSVVKEILKMESPKVIGKITTPVDY